MCYNVHINDMRVLEIITRITAAGRFIEAGAMEKKIRQAIT